MPAVTASHLAACVHTVEEGVGAGVPEAYAAVSRATTTCEQPVLMRRPGNGLDCCCVLCEARQWGVAAQLQNMWGYTITADDG